MRWIPALLLLSACPQDVDAASFTPADGGVWVGGPDGGAFIADKDTNTSGYRKVLPFPPNDIVCMLFIGDINEQNSYPKAIGIWIDDIRDPRFLGAPNTEGNFQENDAAHLRYTYQKPGSTMPPGSELVSLSLSFEKVNAVKVPAEDGVPWPNRYFLNGVDFQGIDSPPCLAPIDRDFPETHYVPCTWCAGLNQFEVCTEPKAEDCYRH